MAEKPPMTEIGSAVLRVAAGVLLLSVYAREQGRHTRKRQGGHIHAQVHESPAELGRVAPTPASAMITGGPPAGRPAGPSLLVDLAPAAAPRPAAAFCHSRLTQQPCPP